MKNILLHISITMLFVPALMSCSKIVGAIENTAGQEIILKYNETFDAVVGTKGERITSVPESLYVGRSTGAGSETDVSDPASKSVYGGSIRTGFYMPVTPVTYNWYVSNQNFSITSSGGAISIVNNNIDVLAARVSSNETAVNIELDHVFACVKTLAANGINGYTISDVTWKIKPSAANCGTAGTFNMKTGTWTSTTALPSAGISVSDNSYMFLIPGEYVIEVSYTATKGNYSDNFTKQATVSLQCSKYNNIVANLDGTASEVILSLSIETWETVNHTPTFIL